MGLTMTRRDALRARARQLREEARAAEESSDGLVHLLHSLECDEQADALEHADARERENA